MCADVEDFDWGRVWLRTVSRPSSLTAYKEWFFVSCGCGCGCVGLVVMVIEEYVQQMCQQWRKKCYLYRTNV